MPTGTELGNCVTLYNLFLTGYSNVYTPRLSVSSDLNNFLENPTSIETHTSPACRSFLGQLMVRKPSILSISSAVSSPGSTTPNIVRRASSSMQEEEKRKILQMLISPSTEKKPNKNINKFMLLANETARSAENLSKTNQVKDQSLNDSFPYSFSLKGLPTSIISKSTSSTA